MPRLFCFGLGYTALALARRLKQDGWTVAGTCRREEKRKALADNGIEAFLFDDGRPLADPSAALAGTTHLLSSISPGRSTDGEADCVDPVLAAHDNDISAIEPPLQWVGYLSTTSVYGDRDGAWTDESAPLAATSARGRRRIAAEQAWLDWGRETGVPVHCFRLAGIYGPGRSAIDQLRRGSARRIDKPGQVFNRIHVEDIATIVQASMNRPRAGGVYNCADDDPAPSHEVVAHAAELLGVDPPPLVPFDQAELSPMGRSFYAENKRTDNGLIKRELAVRLAHPTYREGLAAQLACEKGSGNGPASPPSRSGPSPSTP
ncbi:MAG: SDR family oxidoreductase [Pseudomonadota bacterium]